MVWDRTLALVEMLKSFSDGTKTIEECSHYIGRCQATTSAVLRKYGIPYRTKPRGFASPLRVNPCRSKDALEKIEQIKMLADGSRSAKEIAQIAQGVSAKYVQRIFVEFDLPRLRRGAQRGACNPSYAGGRRIDPDGYVYVSAPDGHPNARVLPGKNVGHIYEHRLVMESSIGRYLQPAEVVDHIDGIRLHNSPDNLRLFSSNQDHLRATIRGQVPQWSVAGFQKMQIPPAQRQEYQRVCKYSDQRKCGDVRLKQILLAWLSLDRDSPYLLGTHRWLEKAEIFDLSHSSLRHHLQNLLLKWGENPLL